MSVIENGWNVVVKKGGKMKGEMMMGEFSHIHRHFLISTIKELC